jgi:short-subunit dehydrogenase
VLAFWHRPGVSNTYFVTGGTGLIGRELVPRLLARGGEVRLLIREAAQSRQRAFIDRLHETARAHGATLRLVTGDVAEPNLGLSADDLAALKDVAHVFHLAAVYSLEVSDDRFERVNVGGTRHLLEALRGASFAGVLHHASSVAVAGDFAGTFTEEMLEAGQRHTHPYFASKYESERLVRAATDLRVRVYRPSAVVGHSVTGEMDRVDGPYYLFEPIRRIREVLPPWVPLPELRYAPLNMVPVDFVAAAIDAIAHRDGLDGKTFHVVDPSAPSFVKSFNAIAKAAGAPRMRKNPLRAFRGQSKAAAGMAGQLASVKFLRHELLRDLGLPPTLEQAQSPKLKFDATHLVVALEGTGVRIPAQAEYVEAMWDYWHRHLSPPKRKAELVREAFDGRRVLVTGASSGIGEAFALRAAELGARLVLVARRKDELERVAGRVRERGGEAHVVVADLATLEGCDEAVREALSAIGGVDVLVNNAGHSIRRSLVDSMERWKDVERLFQLNFMAPVRLIRGFLPGMRDRRDGVIVNVLSAGTHMATPNFGVYTSSKAALSQFSNTLAAEHAHENIHVLCSYLPFVRTPMMGATGLFDETSAMTPERAAEWMITGVARRERMVAPRSFRAFYMTNFVAPRQSARILNLLYRIWSDTPGEFPELALERAVFEKTVGSRWL